MRRERKAKLNYTAFIALLAGLFIILYSVGLSGSAYLQKDEKYLEREHDYVVSLAANPLILSGTGIMLFAIGLVFLRSYKVKFVPNNAFYLR